MKLMKKLSLAPGVSGGEEKVAKIIENELKDIADDIEYDDMGNLIVTKKGSKKAPKIMLAAHMDEIGLIVKYIDENGYIRFSKMGGINDQMLMNQTVTIHSSVGKNVIGVIGSKPPHVTKPEERNKIIKYDDMFIDIGAKDKEDAEKMVRIGDLMTFNAIFAEYPNNLIMGKALDNRVGCYVMIEVFKRLDVKATFYAVGTTQEELGLKGARVTAHKLNPDLAFALDVTISGDHPGIKPEDAPVVIGEGPALILSDGGGRGTVTPKSVKDLLINAADENDIKYQLEVSDGGTTDATVIQLTRDGIPTGVLSVPTRYVHTPVSVCSMDDVESTIQLIVAAINDYVKK